MGDVVDFVGSDQPGHLLSFIAEVIHGARIDSPYVRACAGAIAQLCARRQRRRAHPGDLRRAASLHRTPGPLQARSRVVMVAGWCSSEDAVSHIPELADRVEQCLSAT